MNDPESLPPQRSLKRAGIMAVAATRTLRKLRKDGFNDDEIVQILDEVQTEILVPAPEPAGS